MANTVKPKTWEEFKKSAGKSSASSSWKEFKEKALPKAAKYDAELIDTNLPNYSEPYYENQYKMGGSAEIKGSGVIPMFGQYGKYAPIASGNLASGMDYLGMTDEEVAEYQKAMVGAEKEALHNYNTATARSGGLDSIDTSGMKKSEVKELGRMGNLSDRDDTYAKIQQFPGQEEFEANRGYIFNGMSEKEYLDQYTAYLRDQKHKNEKQAKHEEWQQGADAAVAEAKTMPEYESLSQYVPDEEYLYPNMEYLEGLGNYTTQAGDVISADEYRKNTTDAFLAAFVDAGNDPAKRKQIEFALEMMPELNNYNIEAVPYMTDDQKGAFFAKWNSGDRDGAKQLLKTLDYGLQKERVETEQAETKAALEQANGWEKFLYSLGTIPQNLLNEAVGATQALAGVFNPEGLKDAHEYSAVYDSGRESQQIRGQIGQDIAANHPGWTIPGTDMNLLQMGYNAGVSMADSMANAALFGWMGPVAPTVMMGSGAFATEYAQNQNYLDALASGAIEAGTEFLPFDIIGRKNIKPGAKILYNMLAEGLGESTAEIANIAYDVIKKGQKGDASHRVDELMTQGYTRRDAILQTVKEYGLDVLESGITGAMSGGSAAPTAITETIADTKSGKALNTNEAVDDLVGLAETVPVSDAAKDIIRRWKAERAESKKGEQAETATEDKAAVTKEAAAAEAQETEQASRDRAERAGETKSDGSTVDAAAITKNYAEAVKNREQASRDRKEASGKKKGDKAVSNAEIGYLYRQAMSNLDKGAQQVVSETFSRDVVESELAKSGYRGDMRWAADVVTKFINGNTGKNIIKAIESNEVVRQVALEFMGDVQAMRGLYYAHADSVAQRASKDYVKPETTKAEKGAQEATEGIDDRAAVTEDDVFAMTDEDIDVEIADTEESTVNGRAVTIEGVAKVAEDGRVTYTVKDADGNVSLAAEDEVTFGQNDSTVARLAEMAKDLGRNAETMIKSYVDGQSVAQYAKAFKKAMQYGEDGQNLEVVKGRTELSVLNEAQAKVAYEMGRGIRTQRNNEMVRKNVSGITVGTVDTSGINGVKLTDHQKKSVHTMSRLAKAVGFNIRFVESKANAEGKYTTENGSWDPRTLTLTLDVHAGSNSTTDTKYAMMHTAGHELTHYIRQFADADLWNGYQEFVIGHLSKKTGENFDLETEIANGMRRGLSRDAAIEEVIADASGEALNSITEANIQAMAETNPGLLEKVKQFFERWIKSVKAAIKAAYKDTEAKTGAAKKMMDAVDEMGKRWNEMLVNATQNRAADAQTAMAEDVASETTIPNVEVSKSGDTAYVNADALYSLRTFNESDYVAERDKAAAALAKKMGITAEKAEAYIDDVTSIAAMVAADRDRLDFEAENEYTALKHNSEYKFTIDFSTLCKKRLMYTGTFDAIQKQMPDTALTEDDYIRLRQMMADRGYEVACAFCYIESRRKNNGEIINKFLDVYKDAQRTGGQMELGPSNRRKAFKVEDGFTPNIADFNTSEGIANIMHNHRDVYDAYMYFMNARGVSKPKLIESRTEYSSEILRKFRSASAVKAMNRRGGLRLQSFSDFKVVNMLDMMQVVMDMSRVGLMSQAYTKVPAFARVFGGTGVKINLSLVTKGVDKNGKLIFDDIEGMPHEEAFKIRDMYSEHVGTILVGKDDATIKAAMADPRIDFIIPYHASGWSTENQNALGIGGYTNFTAGQNETNAATGRGVKNFQPSEYWDYSKTGDENAQIYLEKCREAGRVPKFPQYQNYPGYWKMLIDFKMYDNEGNGSPQRAVRPDYNLSEANRIMKEYTGGHQNLPVAHDVVRDFVKEYQGKDSKAEKLTDSGVKYSLREYSDQQKANWATSKKIVLYQDEKQAMQFVNDALEGKNLEKKMFFGMVPEALARRIMDEADYDRDLTGYNVCIHAKEIRKIDRKHGNEHRESLMGQRAITAKDYVVIPETIEYADTIYMSPDKYMGLDALMFERTIGGSKTTIVAVVGKGNLDLFVQTMYASAKKENLADAADAFAPAITSETTNGTVLDDIISQDEPDVNKFQVRDLSHLSDRELLVGALDTELTEAERDHLERYKIKLDELAKDQKQLEDLNEKIVQLRNQGFTPKTSEELRAAETNATTLRGRIDRKDAELNKIESAAMIKELIRRNRREASKKRTVDLREWQEKEKYRDMLEKDAKKLHKWLVSPTSKGYAPEFLRKPLGDFLEQIDFTSKRALRGGEETWSDEKFKDSLEELRRAIAQLGGQQQNIEKGAEDFMGYIDLPVNFVQDFDENVRAIKKALDMGSRKHDTPVNRMNAQQMREMSQMFRVLNSSIVKVNTLVSNGRYTSAKLAADDTINDLNEMKARAKTNKALEQLNSTFNWKNTTPYYVFQRLGRGGKDMFERLMNGWDKMAYNSAKVIEYAENTFTGKEAREWSREITEVKLDSEDVIQMTTAQKMSIYCLQKRPQAQGHLLGGGIRISDIDGKRGSKITQADNYVLTADDIYRITTSLTERQREVADKLQEFMNTVCAEWGNEISMKRFGFRQMTELMYFPIETDSNNRKKIDESKDGSTSMFRLLNMSSLKPLVPKANNAIVIKDIFNVFSDHASDMAKYNALALPILDFIKWYNHVEVSEVRDDSGRVTGQITTRSTQKALERAFGTDAKSYLTAFVKDINAEHDGGRNDGLINSIVGRAKSAAVGANLRVYGLQITSLPRAAFAINPAYLIKGMAKVKSLNPASAIKGTEAQENVGILKWKNLGFYSTDVARSTRGMVKRSDGFMAKVRDIAMMPAGWGDNWVSNIIYEAAKAELADKRRDLKPGTKAYEKALNDRVREIVYKTQVVDSTMTRSDFMRSKGLMSTLTAFMSEPTLTVNMLNEGIQKAVEVGRKGGNWRKELLNPKGLTVRAATTFVFTAAITSLVESAFDALRDDDEYERFMEKFSNAFKGNIIDNVNVFAMLPFLKDAISIFQGYENSSLITQGVQQWKDFKTSIESWQNGKAPIYRVIYNGMKAAGSMAGVGLGNATRDAASLYNTFFAPVWGTPKLQTYEDTESTAAEAYYNAVTEGRTEDAAYYMERMQVNKLDVEKVNKKLVSLAGDDFVAGNVSEADARKWLNDAGYTKDKTEDKIRDMQFKKETGVNYSDFKTEYVAGTISKSEATRLLKKYRGYDDNKVYFTLQEWDGGEDWTKYGDFLDAVDNRSGYAAEAKKLLDHGVEKGDIATAISKAYKATYREIHGTQAGNMMLEYLLDVYEAIGYDRDYERKYITKNWIK